MRIFISYGRDDAARVSEVHDILTDAGHDVWFDQDLRGGVEWWDVILDRLRSTDLVVFVLSPDSAKSRACRYELEYADALNRPIIPIMVRDIAIEHAPDGLQARNVMPFVSPGPREWVRLTASVQETPADTPLPDPLPDPPPAPMADLSEARRAAGRASLSAAEQRELLRELEDAAREEDDRRAVVAVLEQLRARPDVLESVADEIDELLPAYRQSIDTGPVSPLVRRLVADLKKERCTPVIGTGTTDWLFGTRRDLAQKWANEYPFAMAPHWTDDLPQITQYAAVTYSDLVLRDDLGEFYRQQIRDRYPEVVAGRDNDTLGDLALAVWEAEAPGKPDEPHKVLAQLPCSVYVTAQATTLLGRALEEAGKEPVIDFCRWKPELLRESKLPLEDPDYEPSPEKPLVYHVLDAGDVLGTLDVPESIVITEDEYFDFLAAVAKSGPGNPLIPRPVQEAIADTSLLFLGFGLQDWDFRILLRSVMKREAAPRRGQRTKHVAAELDVPTEGVASPEGVRDYIVTYFKDNEPSIEIEWATVDEFSAGLARAWEEYA